MSFNELFDSLATDVSTVSWYNEVLASSNFVSFFWEHPPLDRQSMDAPAEFVLIDAPGLTGLRADKDSFSGPFSGGGATSIVVFDNLGRDARLVAPRPGDGAESCAHLAPFVRSAPSRLVCDFWQALAREVLQSASDAPMWLSTSGLGVSWLHARLDTRPKYYQYAPYKRAP